MNAPKQQQLMSGSAPLPPHQTSKSNFQQEIQSGPKTVTRFPPIKVKSEDTPNLKQNAKDVLPTCQLVKRVSEEPSYNQPLKKTQNAKNIMKRVDKKKPKFNEIKPEIMQKYRSYLQFLNLVNLTNNLKVSVTEKTSNYVLYVGKGNNSGLIKTLFRTYRPWWTVQQNSQSNNINLYWHQLRQNDILDNFKQNNKNENDFQDCSYYIEECEEKMEMLVDKEEVKREESRVSQKKPQIRSHSVTHKEIKTVARFGTTFFNLGMTKRSSSKTKGLSQEKSNLTQTGFGLIKKEDIQEEQGKKKKIVFANPKMWPIFTNYRRIFSQSELKELKKLKIIQQDGKIYAKLHRNQMKPLENRSSYIKMHNHVPNNWNLSNKKALFMNLKNYYQAQKTNPFEFIPMTFHITDLEDKQFKEFQQEYERRADCIRQQEKKKKNQQLKYGFKPKKRNAWLVKPGQNTNQGAGIQVVQSLQEIKEMIGKQKVDKLGRARTHIVQQYIMPFLYQKRKFDIRVYIVLTSINGYQKGYWYQDGYFRTASKQFNMKNLNNKFIHLTNDAVQKYHQDYGKYQPANKLSFADFQRYLDTVFNAGVQSSQKLKFYQQPYVEMKKIAGDMFRSVYTKINPTKKDFTFEVFGLDYMIDDNFKVWLIEANTNPCLELACPLLGRVITGMLENTFKLVVDPIYPPPPIQELVGLTKKLMLPDNLIQTNKFQLIFDEVEEAKDLKPLLSKTPEVKIFEVEEEDEQIYDQNGNQCHHKPERLPLQ